MLCLGTTRLQSQNPCEGLVLRLYCCSGDWKLDGTWERDKWISFQSYWHRNETSRSKRVSELAVSYYNPSCYICYRIRLSFVSVQGLVQLQFVLGRRKYFWFSLAIVTIFKSQLQFQLLNLRNPLQRYLVIFIRKKEVVFCFSIVSSLNVLVQFSYSFQFSKKFLVSCSQFD